MISDLDARDQALDPQKSFIVQAPAGSGKTGLLVYRMLTLLATVSKPQQVLAITFTRKATAEMRERLLELMSFAEQGHRSNDPFEQKGIDLATAVLKQDQQYQWRLLDAPYQLQILTIDSFCAKLTSSMPWLSRLGDKPRTTDQADVHYAAAIEQLLAELLDQESPIAPALKTVLLELDFNYNKARTLFSSMLAKRDQWLRHLLQGNLAQLRPHLEQAWQAVVRSQVNSIAELLPSNTIEELCLLAQYADANLSANGKPSVLGVFKEYVNADALPVEHLSVAHWRGLCHLLLTGDNLRKTVNITQGFVAKSEQTIRMKSLLAEFADDAALLTALNETKMLPDTQFNEADWQQLLALESVLKVLASFLQLRFRATGECDHSEVTQRANLALQDLANPTDLGLRMDTHLQHILVDEFQDTSHGQIELLKKLTDGWQDEQSNKTLFLVGDPMQSIYRFREADVSLFLQVTDNTNTQLFPSVDIQPLNLTENFRSSHSLVTWFNTTFQSSFPRHNDVLSGAITYAQASCSKEGGSKEDPQECCDYSLAYDKQQEAELVVKAVQTALPSLPDDQAQIAILVKTRAQLEYLLPSLKQANIPYSGIDIQPLAELQAVIDTVALCKAISREDDRVAWLALLRGPWCGLSLVEIKNLVGSQDHTVWQQLINADIAGLASQSAQRLNRFTDIMRGALRQQQQISLAAVTRWAWLALGGDKTLFEASIEDVEMLFSLIESLDRGGDLPSMKELDKGLQGLYAQPHGTNAAVAPKVVISTMHKSKGLQYHTVILPGLSNPSRSDDKEVMMWAEAQDHNGHSSLLIAPFTEQSESSLHYDYLRHLDKRRSANEAIRLMYVATTRAEQKLVLIARAKLDSKTNALKEPAKNTLLSTVWGALEAKFDAPFEPPLEQEELAELPQTLHRLPEDYNTKFAPSIEWRIDQQLNSAPDVPEEQAPEYDWATPAATAVGIILHDWLQYHQHEVLRITVNDQLKQRWHAELLALRVEHGQIEYALGRLVSAIVNVQSYQQAHFLFKDYAEQDNEFSLSAHENGKVKPYRIDRTFIDEQGTRWIVDYKSTPHDKGDVAEFAKEQVASRHRPQLEKYGALFYALDARPIKLAVYFPLLKQLIVWPFQADSSSAL